MSRGGWRNRDLTQGGLFGSLFVLALPLMASGVLGGAVFQLFDLTFVSRLGEEAISAVVITNQTVRQVAFMFVMGATFATQSLMARAVGSGDTERAEHMAGQSLCLGVMLALVVALLGGFVPGWLFSLAGPDPTFYALGVPYLQLVFLLFFGVVISMLFGAILGGAGDTTTPLLIQLVQFPVAIGAEYLLIFGHAGFPELGVRGVAAGVACGHVVSIGLGAFVLFRGRARVHLRLRHLVPDGKAIGEILRLAAPSALQMIGGVAVNFAFIRMAGGFGEEVQSAYAIGLRLSMVIPMVCFPMATACATLVGQAIGAGNVPRAWRAIRTGVVTLAAVMWPLAVGIFVFRTEIVTFFSDAPQVVAIGSEFLAFTAANVFLWAFQFVFMRSLQGAGDFVVPMLLSVGNSLLVTIPLGYLLSHHTGLGPTGLWASGLVSSVVATGSTAAWLATGRWTRRASHSASP
ncbi:MAG: MATE family efflux transporter [Myxococcota bacterium]